MKYLIYGAGGTGGCLAAFMTQGEKDVTLIARGKHLSAIQEQDLILETAHGSFSIPVQATDIEHYYDTPDVIFLCVKGYSIPDILPDLRRISKPKTIIIPILNIFTTGAKLQQELPHCLVTDGCIYIASELKCPGTIHMSGEIFRVVFGVRTAEDMRPELKQIANDLCDCGIEGILSNQIQRDALMKFSVVSPMAACGIYHNVKVAGMQIPGHPREDFKSCVQEISALATAMGYPFPDQPNPVERSLAIQDGLDPDASTSLKRDLDAGKPSEVDGLIFEVVRLGRQYHVPTPTYDKVAQKLGFSLEELV